MTSKERVLRNYHFQPVDRFTIDFCAESKVYALLREHYAVRDDLALMERLHVDFRYPKPNWIGFPLVDVRRTISVFHARAPAISDTRSFTLWPRCSR